MIASALIKKTAAGEPKSKELRCGKLVLSNNSWRTRRTASPTGTLAFTFSKHGDAWKIDAQAWDAHLRKRAKYP
jgi:hypothetical protein